MNVSLEKQAMVAAIMLRDLAATMDKLIVNFDSRVAIELSFLTGLADLIDCAVDANRPPSSLQLDALVQGALLLHKHWADLRSADPDTAPETP